MKIISKEVNKPISLDGCIQVLNSVGIDYLTWNINKIFSEAERISKEQDIKCNESFIEIK